MGVTKKLLFFLLIIGPVSLSAQKVLWASEVLEVSSEHTDQFYSPKNRAVQILGKPSVYPQMTVSPCAWQPNGSDFGEDYIKVGFEEAIVPKQIAIVENWNAGAIARIFGYDLEGKEHLLYQSNGVKPSSNKRFWHLKIEEVNVKIKAVKLLVNHRMVRGDKQYDAIAVSDSDELIKINVNIAEDIPADLERINLGPIVNSGFGEVAPIITPDGKTLYFTRLDHPENIKDKKNKEGSIGQDIWYSKLGPDKEWMNPVNIGEPINNELDNAAATASSDGNSLYILNIYHPSGKLLAGLSKTKYRGKLWSMPEKVEIDAFQAIGEINPITKATEIRTEYAMSHDEEVLIMGLQRSQTFGGKDLYVSFRKADGTYSIPKNMGNVINTADNEGSPFISADKKTLYFNSKGHPGYGEADIFMSRRLDDSWTSWSEPLNLGPKINSDKWDGYFSIPASGDFAYLSSKDNSIGGEDIFKIKLYEAVKPEALAILNATVVESGTNQNLQVPVQIMALGKQADQKSVDFQQNDETGDFKAIMSLGQNYVVTLQKAGYLSISDTIFLAEDSVFQEINKKYELIPVKEGTKLILTNLIFEQGRFEIQSESFGELDKLIALMKEYPNMRILLEGHTDNQGDFSLNVKLAEERVNAVRSYLVDKGNILARRIETKSWGPLKPISSNATPETRIKNRRVEFTILKM